MRALPVLAAAMCLGGCGLVFQGFHQDVQVQVTNPMEATVTLSGEAAPAPATFRVGRRTRWRVVRAEAPGMGPACKIVRCHHNRTLKTLDLVFFVLPYAFDSALGTLSDCQSPIRIGMPAMPLGVEPYSLPTDEEIFGTYSRSRRVLDVCRAPHIYDDEFGKQASRIIITSGQLQQPYEIIGPFDVTIEGFDRTTSSYVAFGNFGSSQSTRTFYQARTGWVNEVMRREILLRYGNEADAVINVDYMTNPKNDVSATGLIVRFKE